MLRPLSAWLFVVSGVGCAAPPQPVSPAAAAMDATSDHPGGNAARPVDAALERLLTEPLGTHVDYWHTLAVPLPDRPFWKGTRFKRFPARAAYRYGKERIALSVVVYAPADGDDSPAACLNPLLDRARSAASAYGLELGPMRREVRRHHGGPERVDWPTLASAATPSTKQTASSPAGDERQRKLMELKAAQPYSDVALPSSVGEGEMQVVRMSAKLNTLFSSHEYAAAIVAYESWPGTCLIQGFAARVGDDELLSRRVVTRWVEDAARKLAWADWLREAPPIENR